MTAGKSSLPRNKSISSCLGSGCCVALWELSLPRTGWTPSIVPTGDDQNVYIVLDDFGRIGRAYRETDVERADLESIITDMLRGEYSNPVRVIGFNTAEGWSQDVSADVAQELRHRCDLQQRDVPYFLEGFTDRHEGRYHDVQLPLPIRLVLRGDVSSQPRLSPR